MKNQIMKNPVMKNPKLLTLTLSAVLLLGRTAICHVDFDDNII